MKLHLIIIISLLILACSENSNGNEYEQNLKEYRNNMIAYFLSDASPLKGLPESKKRMPLFYDADEDFKVTAFLNVNPDKDTIQIRTTKKDVRMMVKYGEFEFKIGEQKYSLNAYMPLDNTEAFFVPFTDMTNGESTYDGGRYLDIPRKAIKRYTLDFNYAYNPYCYYNSKYSCPLVPKENHLNVKIEAGEKAVNEKH